MADKEYTCGNCENLKFSQLRPNYARMYYCGKTELIIPHQSDQEKAVFTRIPLNCPVESDLLFKSDNPAPELKHITIEV